MTRPSGGPTPANERETGVQARHYPTWVVGLGSLVVWLVALVALVPTVGDFGLTWDEPAYRYSQVLSAQWWEQLAKFVPGMISRSFSIPFTLLYYWPYGRYGVNFHPPLAGQLNLAAHAVFGHWMKDIPARRMASVIEFALTITIGFHFLARRYGGWVAVVMAGSLLFLPRLYGQAHIIDTDTPGLLLWSATALAFWKGLHERNGRAGESPLASWPAWRSSRRWRRCGAVPAFSLAFGPLASPPVRPPGRAATGSTASSRRGRCWPRWAWRFSRSRCCNSSSRRRHPDPFIHRPKATGRG